jgi:hypothetical protein
MCSTLSCSACVLNSHIYGFYCNVHTSYSFLPSFMVCVCSSLILPSVSQNIATIQGVENSLFSQMYYEIGVLRYGVVYNDLQVKHSILNYIFLSFFLGLKHVWQLNFQSTEHFIGGFRMDSSAVL